MITHDVDEAVLLSDRIVMMSNGPAATIGEILPVTLPRPRDRLALAEDPEFVHLRQQVLAFLYAKHELRGGAFGPRRGIPATATLAAAVDGAGNPDCGLLAETRADSGSEAA